MKKNLLFCLLLPFFGNAQVIVTVAGSGMGGYSGDGGPATNAKMTNPYALAFDKSGNFYFSDDANGIVRKVSPSGIISIAAGNSPSGYCCDGNPAIHANIGFINGIAADAAGNIYLAAGGEQRVLKITPDGIIHTIAGTGTAGYNGDGIPATNAKLNSPESVAVDDTGNVYICDRNNYRIRKINSAGIISTIAGTGVVGYTPDNARADTSAIDNSWCVVIDGSGNILFNDYQRIRKIQSNNGLLTTLAGTGTYGYSGDDGPATAATIYTAQFTIDSVGNLYLGEGSNRIRKINTEGTITTVAGTGSAGLENDGANVLLARLHSPRGVAFSPSGELHFADGSSARIRKITNNWMAVADRNVASTELEIFPNPAHGSISLRVISHSKKANVMITDVKGVIIQEIKVHCNVIRTLEFDWLPGIYTVSVTTEDKTIARQITIE